MRRIAASAPFAFRGFPPARRLGRSLKQPKISPGSVLVSVLAISGGGQDRHTTIALADLREAPRTQEECGRRGSRASLGVSRRGRKGRGPVSGRRRGRRVKCRPRSATGSLRHGNRAPFITPSVNESVNVRMRGKSVGATSFARAPPGEARARKRTQWAGDVEDADQTVGLGLAGHAVRKSDFVAVLMWQLRWLLRWLLSSPSRRPERRTKDRPWAGGSLHRALTHVAQCPAQPQSRARPGAHGGQAGQDRAQACPRERCRAERWRDAAVAWRVTDRPPSARARRPSRTLSASRKGDARLPWHKPGFTSGLRKHLLRTADIPESKTASPRPRVPTRVSVG